MLLLLKTSSRKKTSKRHSSKRHQHPISAQPAPVPLPTLGNIRMSAKRNLKGDLEKVLQKVRKVQTNKKVMKYKQRLVKCVKDANCDINDKTCIKTHCNNEMKKYTKRFNKEYKRIE